MTNDDLNLYIMAEINYQNVHKNENNIFPIDWYSVKNYKLKTEIIAESLKKNIKIEETELYQNSFVEGIRTISKKIDY